MVTTNLPNDQTAMVNKLESGTCETSRLGLVSLKSRTFGGSRPGLGLGLVDSQKPRLDSVSVSLILKNRD